MFKEDSDKCVHISMIILVLSIDWAIEFANPMKIFPYQIMYISDNRVKIEIRRKLKNDSKEKLNLLE